MAGFAAFALEFQRRFPDQAACAAWLAAARRPDGFRRPACGHDPGVPGLACEPHVVGAMAAAIISPRVRRVFASLKTAALGVHHGLRRRRLQACLDKFAFRFTRRRTPHAVFRTLLGVSAAIKPVTYTILTAPEVQR